MLARSKLFNERPDARAGARRREKRIIVQPAALAGLGNTRGVAIFYARKPIVLTEHTAIELINEIAAALEGMEEHR